MASIEYHNAGGLRTVVSKLPSEPTIVFDGDCGFCRRWVQRWKGITGEQIQYVPINTATVQFPDVPVEQFKRATHLIEPTGAVTRGARAVFGAFALAGRKRHWLWLYERSPIFARTSELAYRVVSSHRGLFNWLDLSLLGRNTLPITHFVMRRWFLRILAIIYGIAFVSLWVQIHGLIGSRGILPIHPLLQAMARQPGWDKYLQAPTMLWINSSDAALTALCAVGVALSVLLFVRIVPALSAFLLWLCYLSLVVGGQDFLGFQWDALLLEAGFLAIFFSPLQWLPNKAREPAPARVVVWLYRWLLFRLIFLSGLVKLLSSDTAWRDLSAMKYHYWTQPLPTWLSWYANRLPEGLIHLSTLGVFYVELVVPVFMLGPRRLRLWAFRFTVGFQCLILATGNFGFFNLLTIALCLTLLDDTFWPLRLGCPRLNGYARVRAHAVRSLRYGQRLKDDERRVIARGHLDKGIDAGAPILSGMGSLPMACGTPHASSVLGRLNFKFALHGLWRVLRVRGVDPARPALAEYSKPTGGPPVPLDTDIPPATAAPQVGLPSPRKWSPWITLPLAAFLISATSGAALHRLARSYRALHPGWRPAWAAWAEQLAVGVGPLNSTNAYGLFEVMTRDRPEIIIEGSDDGLRWKPYAFKWKPGDVSQAPAFCIGHMPRLDWQMWFAALQMRDDGPPHWFVRFLQRLLEGSPPVAGLMEKSPFGKPPRYVRATIYFYRFATPEQRRQTGAWWQRRESDIRIPPLMLGKDGRLMIAPARQPRPNSPPGFPDSA